MTKMQQNSRGIERRAFNNKRMSTKAKDRIYKTFVGSIIIYAGGGRTDNTKKKGMLIAAQMKILRNLKRYSLAARNRNEKTRETRGV